MPSADGSTGIEPAPRALKPLPPPRTLLSPIEWSQKRPAEETEQKERQARRAAQHGLGLLYRDVLQNRLGLVLYKTTAPWPPYIDYKDLGPEKPVPAWKVYKKPPFEPASALSKSFSGSLADFSRKDPLLPSPQALRRKSTVMGTLHEWGRTSHGAPVTLKQIYAEIEAKDRWRKAKDTRTERGCLGPLVIGQGTSRARRSLPLPFLAAAKVG
eukprot:TRINITY_DN71616_c0_g1_i1.p1 TRINITY_DN71616_c0_g1~~TRINITY_DN71616_c0_g1_i1.p1  ORF type:complete len:239 (-),score=30.61 TRINITY_DN71616_c0_g1_i1:64-702(-)